MNEVNEAIFHLNAMAGFSHTLVGSTSCTASLPQRLIISRLVSNIHVLWLALQKSKSEPVADAIPDFYHHLLPETVGAPPVAQVKAFEPLHANQMALPPPGMGGNVNILDYELRDGLTDMIRTEEGGLLLPTPPSSASLKSIPILDGIAPGEKCAVYQKLIGSNIARFLADGERPKEICGLFGKEKSPGEQRILYDGRRSNTHFVSTKSLNALDLVSPTQLSNIMLESPEIFVGQSDVECFFYRIMAPTWLQSYMGLPPV